MREFAAAWTHGFQAPRASRLNGSSTQLLQGVVTLKHMAAYSLENSDGQRRGYDDVDATFGMSKFVLADYYPRPFRAGIVNAGARGASIHLVLAR